MTLASIGFGECDHRRLIPSIVPREVAAQQRPQERRTDPLLWRGLGLQPNQDRPRFVQSPLRETDPRERVEIGRLPGAHEWAIEMRATRPGKEAIETAIGGWSIAA